MGFIKAFAGAVGGTLADQWKDYLMPMEGAPATAAIIPAVNVGQNNGRGSNTKGSVGVITNGSKIVVPEGMALVTMQEGAITGLITEVGGFTWTSDDTNSKSIFAGDGFVPAIISQSWERFKFGGMPAAQQLAYYVNLKEIPNNRFGTQGEIYWDDAFLQTQVGAVARGTYTLKIVDPLLFIKSFVPQVYLTDGMLFDFADMNNQAGEQLFNEVVGSLSAALSLYTNDPSKGNRISKIQQDQIGFAKSLSEVVEQNYQWKASRGLEIVTVAIQSIEYDADTKALLSEVKRTDALSGNRADNYMKQNIARGFEGAGQNGGAAGMAFMGMGVNAVNGMFGGVAQQQQDPSEQLAKYKKMLDDGLINQEDYEAAKKKILGL